MNLRHPLALLPPLLLLACDRDKSEKRQVDDTGPALDADPAPDSGPGCDTGYLDEGGECVPVACGTGTWGHLEADESTVFVDMAAAEGGDGSRSAPLTSIQAGLDAAGDADGGMVAVAAGSYPETLQLDRAHDGVHLAGRCRELVVIDASVGDDETPGMHFDIGSSEAEVSGVALSGSQYIGILVGSGTVSIRDSEVVGSEYIGIVAYQDGSHETSLVVETCDVVGNKMSGLLMFDSATSVALRETSIQDSLPDENGQYGYGIDVSGGANLTVEGCHVSGNTEAGVLVYQPGTTVTLRDTSIQDSLPDENGDHGHGIDVFGGANLTAEACEVSRNRVGGVGAFGSRTTVHLHETTIEGTRPDDKGNGGYGIAVEEGATLTAEACDVSGNTKVGVIASRADTSVLLLGTTVRDTSPDGRGELGYGIGIHGGASLEAEACELAGNRIGVGARDHGTSAILRETTIHESLPDDLGGGGFGIEVHGGASLEAETCELADNTGVGVLVIDSDSTAKLRETRILDTHPRENGSAGYGVQVYGGANLEAEACEVLGSTSAGVVVMDSGSTVVLRETAVRDTQADDCGQFGYGIGVVEGAYLEAQACEVIGSTTAGVFAFESGTSVSLRETIIASTRRGGDSYTHPAQQSATVQATGVEVSSNEGPGLYVVADDAQLTCSGCLVQDNQFAGAIVVWDGSLILDDSTIERTTGQENLGGGVGIYAEPWEGGPPTLSVANSSILENPSAGVWLSEEGSYSLSGNTIHGGDGWKRESLTKCGDAVYARDGVTAWDGSSGLLLEDNELLNGLGAGLFLDDATGMLSGNAYADNAVDLVMQGADCATPPEGFEEEALGSAELCPSYDYATCGDEFSLVLTLAVPETGHGGAFMRPGLPAPRALQVPATPAALSHAFHPLALLPSTPRLEPPELQLHPLRHERPPPVPLVLSRTN